MLSGPRGHRRTERPAGDRPPDGSHRDTRAEGRAGRRGAWWPYLTPALVAVLWGFNNVLIKLLATQMAPVPLVAYRMVAACLFLVPAAWVCHPAWRPSARTWGLAALTGGLIVVVHQVLLTYGMGLSPAGVGTLILSLNPPTTSLLAALAFRERLTPSRVAGVAIGMAGVWLAVLGQPGRHAPAPGDPNLLGELLLAGAMLSYVVASLVIQVASRKEPVLAFTALSQALGVAGLLALMGAGLVPGQAAAQPGAVSLGGAAFWALVLASGAVSTGLGNFLWNQSIQWLGAGRTSMFLNGMPLSGMLAAGLLLGEPVGWAQVAGLACVMAGVALGVAPPRARRQGPGRHGGRVTAPGGAQVAGPAYASTASGPPAAPCSRWPAKSRRRAT